EITEGMAQKRAARSAIAMRAMCWGTSLNISSMMPSSGTRVLVSSRWCAARRGSGRGRIDHAVVIGHHVARVTIDRRPRPFGQHSVVPGIPITLKPIENILFPVLEIGPLTRVLNHIEEELVPRDPQIFPIAVADGALRTGLISPIQLARMRCSAASYDG